MKTGPGAGTGTLVGPVSYCWLEVLLGAVAESPLSDSGLVSWLKTTVYSLTVLEAKSLESKCCQGLAPSSPLPGLVAAGTPWLVATPLQSLPLSLPLPLLHSQISLCLTLLRTFVLEFRAHSGNTG